MREENLARTVLVAVLFSLVSLAAAQLPCQL